MSNFEINNKLFSTTGIIGRRNFIVNYLTIKCIKLLLLTPVFYLFVFNPDYIGDFYQNILPQWFSILWVITNIISATLLFPSIVRRIRDILAIDSDEKLNLIATTVIVIFIISSTPIMNATIGNFLSTFGLFLLFLCQGKITSQKPKNEVIKFNWGAFFGTWIWGIINKKPITFLMIPLFFTLAWLPFMLICGLKGNEWAYETSQDNFQTIENFHKKQSDQSRILVIISPILFIIISVIMLFSSGYSLYEYSKSHPQFKTKFENLLLKHQEISVKSFYSKIEILNGNATFYLEPETWKSLNNVVKESTFKNAISYALQQQGKKGIMLQDFIENIELVNNVKILSSFNNEPLATFYLEPKQLKEQAETAYKTEDFAKLQKLWISGYNFNNTPTLP